MSLRNKLPNFKGGTILKKTKTIISLLIAIITICAMAVPTLAAGFSDVSADAWYSESVAYIQDNGIMSGTTETEFEPNASMSRAMLAMVLYRMEGSPAVSGTDNFTDTLNDAWYANAVYWASEQNLIGGYGNNLFGTNDPVSREQIATILWRYAKSPEIIGNTESFADANIISNWATTAVEWAKENNIVGGKGENLFDPAGQATRAEVATILRNYLTNETIIDEPVETPVETPIIEPIIPPITEPIVPPVTEPETPDTEQKSLVVYFSMPETTNPNNMTTDEENSTVVINGEVLGNTQYVAYIIQENTGADIFRIEPRTPYTTNHSALVDLARVEQSNNARPTLLRNIENLEDYDVIFIGYPNWFSDLPMVLYSFLETHDLSGKTIIPFNTHGGSGFSNTISTIAGLQPNASVIRDGFTVSRNVVADSENNVIAWLNGLNIN